MSTLNIGTSGNQNIPTWSLQIDGAFTITTTVAAGTQQIIPVPLEINATDAIINSTKDLLVSSQSITIPSPGVTINNSGALLNPTAIKLVKKEGGRLFDFFIRSIDENVVTIYFANNDPMDFNY